MKLDYATLISPYPFVVEHVGSIKAPTLREIWNPTVTYQVYSSYLMLLLMTPKLYCEKNDEMLQWFSSLSDDEKSEVTMMVFISQDAMLRDQYIKMLNFFFVEDVIWDNENMVFIAYTDTDDDGQVIPIGLIHYGIWNELCDVILQRCGVKSNDSDLDESKAKNKKALEILKKLKKGNKALKNKNGDKGVDLPTLITAVAVKSNSVNFLNIWDLTVYQFYEQFRKEQTNISFDIMQMSVAAWGNEKKSFKGDEWYKNEN